MHKTYLLLAVVLGLAISVKAQSYYLSKNEKSTCSSITPSIKTIQTNNQLTLELIGYPQEHLKDVSIMTKLGIIVKTEGTLQSKKAVLDITHLDINRSYLIHLKTSSEEVFIEKFMKVI